MKKTDKEYILAKTAMLAGMIILSSGGETMRAEDTATRILLAGGVSDPEVIAYSTSMTISLVTPSGESFTVVKRIKHRTIHLNKITKANEISRDFCAGRIDVYEAYQLLNEVLKISGYPKALLHICTLLTPATFTILLAGSLHDCIVAGILGVFLVLGDELQRHTPVNSVIYNFAMGIVIALSGYLISTIPHLNITLEILLPGTIMALLPGVTITNGVHDMLNADYMSGSARFVEAIVTAATLAIGIGFGLGIGALLTGGAL